MNLYNKRMCIWCWEIDRLCVPAKWTVVASSTDAGGTYSENVCETCKGQFGTEEYAVGFREDCDPDYKLLEVKPFIENPIPLFFRGDRVEIVRVNRPKMAGTVVHCYLSMRDFSPKVNIVIDGKKWPAVFPAHIVQKRVITNQTRAAQ